MRVIKYWFASFLAAIPFLNESYGQEIEWRGEWVDDVPSQGELCAIMKAHQLTDLSFSPLDSIRANPGKKYLAGKEYRGMLYSSVKETNTFVGLDVSLHTFMTALHNPRSVIYTEKTDTAPYHGINCCAYYGVVCNTFVSYALGLNVSMSTFDFSQARNMMLVEDQSSRGVRLADIVHLKTHVMLVTRIGRNPVSGKAEALEISEATRPGCRRIRVTGQQLDKNIASGKWTLYRYKDIESNTYTPMTDFVAVDGEERTPFRYNDAICADRGDKACYVVGDTVTLNVASGYERLEIYKDSLLFQTLPLVGEADIRLTDLPYGDYRARVVKDVDESDFTCWSVIDVQVDVDVKHKQVCFRSANALPVYLEFCTIAGVRPTEGVFELTAEDLARGCVDVSSYRMTASQRRKGMFVKVHFQNAYGRVTNRGIRW